MQEKCHRFVFSQLKNVKCFVRISEMSQAATPELLRAKTPNNNNPNNNNQGDFGLPQALGVPGTPLTLCCQSWSTFQCPVHKDKVNASFNALPGQTPPSLSLHVTECL